MRKPKTYQVTQIAPIIRTTARLIASDPTIIDDIDEPREYSLRKLKSALKQAIPALADKSKCPCCEASMAEYAAVFDIHIAVLLLSMARIVNQRVATKIPFTEANKININREAAIPNNTKQQRTKGAKLGLIAKLGNGNWAITDRGYEALQNKAVPKMRVTFRGKILERPEETTTIGEVFQEHNDRMADKTRRNKEIKTGEDLRESFRGYNMADWYHVVKYHPGHLY